MPKTLPERRIYVRSDYDLNLAMGNETDSWHSDDYQLSLAWSTDTQDMQMLTPSLPCQHSPKVTMGW